jgi:hypothetical protein
VTVTARQIISDCLTFRLNRLSIGETMDADTADRCLSALNVVIDEVNGGLFSLWREILTTGTVSAVSATFPVTWPTIRLGDPVLGATYAMNGLDISIDPITMQQYHEGVALKTTTGKPSVYAYDGAETLYFWPVPSGPTSITLRTQEMRPDFADLDTEYSAPDGWRSGLSAMLAELVAPAMLGGVPPAIQKQASAARSRLQAQSYRPAIIGGSTLGNHLSRILSGN